MLDSYHPIAHQTISRLPLRYCFTVTGLIHIPRDGIGHSAASTSPLVPSTKQNNILNLVIYIEGLRHWVLLDCRVGQVIERVYHFFGEVVIDGRMGLVSKRASGETADVTVFLEGSRPMCFPIGPRLVRLWAVVPFFPSVGEIATLDGVFGPGGDHGGFGDGDACIGGKILSVFLFTSVNGERQGRVDALEES